MNDSLAKPNIPSDISDAELSIHLKRWFLNSSNKRNVWSKNEVGRLLKEELIKMKHWKNKTRGNPKKGWAAKEETRLKSDGFVFE